MRLRAGLCWLYKYTLVFHFSLLFDCMQLVLIIVETRKTSRQKSTVTCEVALTESIMMNSIMPWQACLGYAAKSREWPPALSTDMLKHARGHRYR